MSGLSLDGIRRHRWKGDFDELFHRHVHLVGAVTSTSDVARRLAGEGAPHGSVVIAEEQTASRARHGKRWFSPPGANLYLSALLRPEITLAALPVFSFVASLAVREAIALEGVPAAIKWPNDILIGDQKVAGTLVEAATRGAEVDHVILGIGVNVNVDRATLREGLGEEAIRATSLREAAGHEIDRDHLAAGVLNSLEKWLQVYRVGGPLAVLETWRQHDVLVGRWVLVRRGALASAERVLDVGDDGHLVTVNVAGVVSRLDAEEVQTLEPAISAEAAEALVAQRGHWGTIVPSPPVRD